MNGFGHFYAEAFEKQVALQAVVGSHELQNWNGQKVARRRRFN
jgi:hypothetical protein